MRAPMLTTLESGEDLYMYFSVSEHAVSAMLLKDQGVQQPIYYISKTLVDAETRYLEVGISISSHYEEATPLLSGSYYLRIDRVSFTIVGEEIRFYGKNS